MNRVRRPVLFVCMAALFTVPAGADLFIDLRPVLASDAGREIKVAAERVDGVRETASVTAVAGRETRVALKDGIWAITVREPRMWSPSVLAEVREGSRVVLPVFPTATSRARLSFPERGRAPSELTAWFQSVMDDATWPREAAGEQSVVCSINGQHANCELPLGRFDLAFRIQGYSTVYRWEQRIAAGKITALGTLAFKKGTTVSGRVDFGDTPRHEADKVVVILKPAQSSDLNEDARRQASLMRSTTKPHRRGFFSFDVPPGMYTVHASAGKYRSSEQRLTAIDGRESVLRAPLRLEPRRSLTVEVTPALDPAGKPWTVVVSELESEGSDRARQLSPEGKAVFDDLLPEAYALIVQRNSGHDIFHRGVIDPRDSAVSVAIGLIRVEGTVTHDSKPLSALLTFTDGDRSIRARSNRAGRFGVHLPAGTGVQSRVEVRSANPAVWSLLENVPVTTADDGQRRMALDVPRRMITGEVVDEAGRPASYVVISVETKNHVFQVQSENGVFSISGLPSGPVTMRASSREGQTADDYRLEIAEAADHVESVRLVLRRDSIFRGIVHSGVTPIMGASVWCAPSLLQQLLIPVPSRADGEFQFQLPATATDVACSVRAAGFAFRLARFRTNLEQPLRVLLRQNGATLSVECNDLSEARRPYLFHDGVLIEAGAFPYLGGGQIVEQSPNRLAFIARNVEPGQYALCMLSAGEAIAAERNAAAPQRCVTVDAAAGATAILKQ